MIAVATYTGLLLIAVGSGLSLHLGLSSWLIVAGACLVIIASTWDGLTG